MNNKNRLIALTTAAIFITSCSTTASMANNTAEVSQHPSVNNSEIHTDESTESKKALILQQSKQIQSYLAQGEYEKITPFIHPNKGLRFSMYAYVRPESDKVFSREQFDTYLKQSRIKFTWGQTDGKGDLYITPLPDYLTSWVKAKDFDDIKATYNSFQGSGNSINNLQETYPNADFVEFYNPGFNPEYQGMDWRALRLVFEEYQGKYYLIALINDQWTV